MSCVCVRLTHYAAGYFARVSAVDTLIQRFLATVPSDCAEDGAKGTETATARSTSIFAGAAGKKQIVSLGAGQDTTFFKLAVGKKKI